MNKKIIGITVGTPINPQRLSEYIQDGKSAYELAVEHGFKGTEQEWIESLSGKDGYTPVKGKDYFDGKDGINGKDGVDGYTPVKGKDYFDGKDGVDGQDGYTPVKNIDYFDGQPGTDGRDGIDGKDGYTPIKGVDYFDGSDGKDGISVTHSWDGTTLTINSASGTSSANLKGEKGADGADGYTPIKGTDYFTESDKVEMVSAVIAALPKYNGEVVEV